MTFCEPALKGNGAKQIPLRPDLVALLGAAQGRGGQQRPCWGGPWCGQLCSPGRQPQQRILEEQGNGPQAFVGCGAAVLWLAASDLLCCCPHPQLEFLRQITAVVMEEEVAAAPEDAPQICMCLVNQKILQSLMGMEVAVLSSAMT